MVREANENDMDVLPDANVVAAEFKDGKIFDADATGTLNDLITIFMDLFYEIVDNTSYYENWTIKFFDIILW